MAFWKRRDKPEDAPPPIDDDVGLVERFRAADVELVQVVGPQDAPGEDSVWVGAVLRLGAKHDAFPPLETALSTGLLAPGSKNQLVPYDPKKAGAERHADAMACTQYALQCSGRRPVSAVSALLTPDASSSESPAQERRLKFERVYRAAREADLRGDRDTVLMKARAAADLLRNADLYGERQSLVEAALEARIRTIELDARD